ncbi:hypothetical protein SAMN02745121_07676 [Nannocystis exedens]|uniref:Uncharacterized protein n=1 Tax=Nannocystis exedens TaxID=54 RepID=A0A1I2H4I3_9BACT|nr:HAMP domain-containing histidine kinase [Nannocystis exedens]PCC74037.1 hypothetical protein NAEX_07126 [Nannocystis exedens]SFF24279.1 hypothetical protein SAMN02745121_07676 [Nannocystis exedens]
MVASVRDLAPGDAPVVRRIYDFLLTSHALVRRLDDPKAGIALSRAELARQGCRGLCEQIRGLGAALVAMDTPTAGRKVYHDVRGGSLSGLLMHLDLCEADEAEVEDVERVFFLVRDHLKLMRNALPDLDPSGYATDLAPIEHDTSLWVEKWAGIPYGAADSGRVRIELACEFNGAVSECCMEFAALDRVMYNLIDNASRFASDAVVHVQICPLAEARETDLRFVVSNLVTPLHRTRLLADLGDDSSKIFAALRLTEGACPFEQSKDALGRPPRCSTGGLCPRRHDPSHSRFHTP